MAAVASVLHRSSKAVREGSRFDGVTSMLVLIGYSIPGFVLGVFLLVMFAGSSFVQWFPLRGLTSANWETLSWGAKVTDYLWHIVLPISGEDKLAVLARAQAAPSLALPISKILHQDRTSVTLWLSP